MMRQRDVSIDILKCMAALLITNSHMELLYGKYSVLATGGAIGDVLFFFCSGFTLLMGRTGRFDNWYKRRINRIYPTVFAWAIVVALLFGDSKNIIEILCTGGGWFVSCIMIYYLILYPVKRYMAGRLAYVFGAASIIVLLWYLLMDRPEWFNMYGNTYFKWGHYFLFMLLGAVLGNPSRKPVVFNAKCDFVALGLCLVVFYGIFFAAKKIEIANQLQPVSLLPLLGVTYYLYKLCNAQKIKALIERRYTGFAIKFIGGLCLEIYLVQFKLFTDKMNSLFPLNLVIMFCVILFVAYIVRCMGRAFAQTFKVQDYDWKEVFRLI